MGPFELFEKTMGIINKQENINDEKEFSEVENIVTDIKASIDGGKLPDACEKLHDFINNYLCDDCFQKEFPLTHSLDNCLDLDYSICYSKNDNPSEISSSICKKCNLYKHAKEDAYSYKNELDHFLTRLLYEVGRNKRNKSNKSNKTSALSGKLEPGLYVLAAEVLAKGKKIDDITKTSKSARKKYLTTIESAAKDIKNIMNTML